MVSSLKLLCVLFIVFSSCASHKNIDSPALVVSGVEKSLAISRRALLTEIRYVLKFDIPAQKEEAIVAHERLSFNLNAVNSPLQLDFKADPSKINKLRINGKETEISFNNEHLLLHPAFLKKGFNVIEIDFIAGDGALNRNADYLYTLFVPDRARTVFPCFDQPDLKSIYTLTLTVPKNWTAIANAEIKDIIKSANTNTYIFNPSDLLSTYHFAFAAGNFNEYTDQLRSRSTVFLYRETDKRRISRSLPAIYSIHSSVLKYLEDWTGIAYPYQKFGFVGIPGFQFAGMEHPGSILYKESSLFLDAGATKSQFNARNNLIAHETAHMWFGNLVTMNWFSDVWMKEVFANFMADKSAGDTSGKEDYKLKFLIDHFPEAYEIDRSQAANAISQPLTNLKDAGTLYGNIIYHKAPIMMRQLEYLMGKVQFQKGIRIYLNKFADGNASWSDLIRILDQNTPANLTQWNKVWVNENGRPSIKYKLYVHKDRIKHFQIEQHSEFGKNRIWPQTFEVSLFYPDTVKAIQLNFNKEKLEVKEAEGLAKPLFILFNSAGDGYGLWPVDPALANNVFKISQPMHRATAYISLYEQMLNGNAISPNELLELYVNGLRTEEEELNLKLLSSYISTIYWQFCTPEQRRLMSLNLENHIWSALVLQKSANNKKHLFKVYQDIYLSREAQHRLYRVWKEMRPPAGVILSEEDYTNLAFAQSLRDTSSAALLKIQYHRISNPDRKVRFEFMMPAVSPIESVRDTFFYKLKNLVNRDQEADVLAALFYLHHPLRQHSAIRYLKPSLELLAEIQATGDIFFPQSWLEATFGLYQSKEAASIVRNFLAANPEYSPKLKAKILQQTDRLFRAEKLIH